MLDFIKRNWVVIAGAIAVFIGFVKWAKANKPGWISWL